MTDKPTIHELEKILEEDDSVDVSDTWKKRAKAAEALKADLLEALKRGLSELRTAQRFYEQAGEPTLAGMAAVAVQISEEAIARAETDNGW